MLSKRGCQDSTRQITPGGSEAVLQHPWDTVVSASHSQCLFWLRFSTTGTSVQKEATEVRGLCKFQDIWSDFMQEHPTDYPQWEDRVMTGSAGQASLFSLVRAQEKGTKGVQGRRKRI